MECPYSGLGLCSQRHMNGRVHPFDRTRIGSLHDARPYRRSTMASQKEEKPRYAFNRDFRSSFRYEHVNSSTEKHP